MYATLGWVNAFLLALLLTPYLGNQIQRRVFKGKNEPLKRAVRVLRKVHKPAGIALLVIGFTHGTMAMGRIALHTGTLLYLSALLTILAGIGFWRSKRKEALKGHKFFALITVLLFLLHWLYPGALRALFS